MPEESFEVPIGEVIPFCGLVCFTCGLYTTMPDLIGCSQNQECLCMQHKFIGCKPGKEEGLWCLCVEGRSTLNPIKTLCMRKGQFFCIDDRCALPFNDEVPNMITVCFFTLYYKGTQSMKFFKKISEL